MIPIPSVLGFIGLTLVALAGVLFGWTVCFLAKRIRVSGWPTYGVNIIVSVVGFLVGAYCHLIAYEHAVELNGQIIGWNSGGTWLGLRYWILQHTLAAQMVLASALIVASWLLNLLRIGHTTDQSE
jgi:hypothetical protein